MSFTLYEMALNPEIQKRAQQEIDSLLETSKGQFNEEVNNKLEFVEQCVMETGKNR